MSYVTSVAIATNEKLPQLVTIRGIAAWWVVIYHFVHLMPVTTSAAIIRLVDKGYLAVDLFFILSGFIIFINYAPKRASDAYINVIPFYWNRFSRVYPIHFCMLTAYLLLFTAFSFFASSGEPPRAYSIAAFFESLALVHAFTGRPLSWNVPSWSISAECGAYLLFPALAFLFARYFTDIKRITLLAISLLSSIVFIFYFLGIPSLGGSVEKMAPVRTILEFSVGMTIGSAFLRYKLKLMERKLMFLALGAGLIFTYSAINVPDYVVFPTVFSLLIAYLCCAKGLVLKVFSNRSLMYLGEISYSTYMVHYFVYDLFKAIFLKPGKSIEFVQIGLCMAAILLLSMFMHRWVEVPAQRFLRTRFAFLNLSRKTT